MRLAVYDLDRTVTAVPTWSLFLLHAAHARAPWRLAALPLVGGAALLRAAGLIDRDRLKEAMHRLLIGGAIAPDALAVLAEDFADRFVARHIRPGARRALAADRAEGRRLVLATAAHRFYAEPIARRLGFDAVIATGARRDAAGRILPAIDGANCYGAAKHAMIRDWLAAQEIDRAAADLRFYSDHASDAPTFAWADDPVAVNPHPPLRRLAAARGWRIADWR